MSFRNITLPQALVLIALLACVVAAYKLFGEVPAAVMLILQGVIAFVMGRGDPPAPPNTGAPDLKVINGGGNSLTRALFGITLALALTLVGCGAALPAIDDPELQEVAAKLSKCRTEARAFVQTSADPQSRETALQAFDVYTQCKKREGVQ